MTRTSDHGSARPAPDGASVPAQPVLRTERLVLEPLADEHLPHEVELDSDPEVLRYIWGRARTAAEVEHDHRRRIAQGRQVPGLGLWCGFLRERPEVFVGLWMLIPPSPAGVARLAGEAELGYRVLRRAWRRGFASEGARALLRHAFADLRLDRVLAQTMAVNEGSRAIMERLGMTFARSFHEEFEEQVAGSEHGEVEYRITREDWLRRQPSSVR